MLDLQEFSFQNPKDQKSVRLYSEIYTFAYNETQPSIFYPFNLKD